MSVKNIILASVLAIVVLAAGSVIGCYFHSRQDVEGSSAEGTGYG